MAKYLVKETSTGTQDNPNYAGETSIVYFGKADYMMAREGNHIPQDNYNHIDYCIEEYGYNRVCDAKRSYTYRHPENSKNWTSVVEIVEIDYTPHITINKPAWER